MRRGRTAPRPPGRDGNGDRPPPGIARARQDRPGLLPLPGVDKKWLCPEEDEKGGLHPTHWTPSWTRRHRPRSTVASRRPKRWRTYDGWKASTERSSAGRPASRG